MKMSEIVPDVPKKLTKRVIADECDCDDEEEKVKAADDGTEELLNEV